MTTEVMRKKSGIEINTTVVVVKSGDITKLLAGEQKRSFLPKDNISKRESALMSFLRGYVFFLW